MRTGETSGYEALARFNAKPKRPPNEWFAEAWEVGLGVELEMKAVKQVLADIRRLPQGYVSFNLSPLAVLDPAFKQLIPKLPYGRFVLEMTEHVPVPDYEELIGFLSELRTRGLRIAVDDAGAGYASFRHILRLNPDLIKLDMSLVRGVDRDQALRSLTAAVTGFAAQMGALVVAEGVETEGELLALRKLGVQYGQGWDLFGEPKPVQEVRRVIRTMPREELHLSSLDI
jgi:EAL domain-containing protein (putative c-di-GMP-specific phosphodiesterase class I)